jgi:hypothetical protein
MKSLLIIDLFDETLYALSIKRHPSAVISTCLLLDRMNSLFRPLQLLDLVAHSTFFNRLIIEHGRIPSPHFSLQEVRRFPSGSKASQTCYYIVASV